MQIEKNQSGKRDLLSSYFGGYFVVFLPLSAPLAPARVGAMME